MLFILITALNKDLLNVFKKLAKFALSKVADVAVMLACLVCCTVMVKVAKTFNKVVTSGGWMFKSWVVGVFSRLGMGTLIFKTTVTTKFMLLK